VVDTCGSASGAFFEIIGRHPGVPVMLAWGVVLVVTILLCIDPESRDYCWGRKDAEHRQHRGACCLVLTMTVVGWSH